MENIPFFILILIPDFPHFYYMLGANLGSLLYGDVPVNIMMIFTVLLPRFCFTRLLILLATSISVSLQLSISRC